MPALGPEDEAGTHLFPAVHTQTPIRSYMYRHTLYTQITHSKKPGQVARAEGKVQPYSTGGCCQEDLKGHKFSYTALTTGAPNAPFSPYL